MHSNYRLLRANCEVFYMSA